MGRADGERNSIVSWVQLEAAFCLLEDLFSNSFGGTTSNNSLAFLVGSRVTQHATGLASPPLTGVRHVRGCEEVRSSELIASGQWQSRKNRSATLSPRRSPTAGSRRDLRAAAHGLVPQQRSLARGCHDRDWSLGAAGHPLLRGWRRRHQREPGYTSVATRPATSADLGAHGPEQPRILPVQITRGCN